MDDKTKRLYYSETTGLPPLKMVLVHADNERQNEIAQTILEAPEARAKRDKQKAIVKLIKHLSTDR
jgi:hypothetical protein